MKTYTTTKPMLEADDCPRWRELYERAVAQRNESDLKLAQAQREIARLSQIIKEAAQEFPERNWFKVNVGELHRIAQELQSILEQVT